MYWIRRLQFEASIDNVVHVPRVLQFIADRDRTSYSHYSPSHYAT